MQVFKNFLFFLPVLTVIVDCVKFDLIEFKPNSKVITVNEGEDLYLTCRANKYIRSCIWRHKDKWCKLRYDRAADKLIKTYVIKVIDPRGRPQSRPVVITIFTQCPFVRPKTSKSSDNHCRPELWAGRVDH